MLLALLAVTVWAYSTSFQGVFLEGDDQQSIVQNDHIRSLWPLSQSLTAPKDTTLAGRPVAAFTFALNYALARPARAQAPATPGSGPASATAFDRSPWSFHLVNLLIHLLSGLLLFQVVRLSLLSPALEPRFGGGSAGWLAGCIAGVWLVHPLQTESVTYIVQRVESLMGLFYLLTLYCVIRAANTRFTDRRWVWGAVLACALGMGTKEAMATAPIVAALWLWILWPQVRFREARTLVAGLAATWLVVAGLALTLPRSRSVGLFIDGWTPWLYLQTQAEVLVHYLKLVFWPAPLVLEYSWLPPTNPIEALPEMAFIGGLVVATAIGLARRQPAALTGAWFFLILAPTSSLLPIATEVAAEHRMYLPLAGVVGLVACAIHALWPRVRAVAGLAGHGLSWPWVVATVLLILALSAQTHARNRDYRSVATMVGSIVSGRPQNANAQMAYGVRLLRQARYAEAEPYLRRALSLPLPLPLGNDEPRSRALTHMYLGSALSAQGNLQEGTAHFEQALAGDPNLTEAHGLLGENLLNEGRAKEALGHFERALQAMPDASPILTRAAWILATSSHADLRDGRKSVVYAERAFRVTGGRDLTVVAALAAAYAETGQFERAAAAIRDGIAKAAKRGQPGMLPELQEYLSAVASGQPIRTRAW